MATGVDEVRELALVQKARGGDERAFVELVGVYQNLVTSVTLSVLGERTLSEDAAQEAFVRAWKSLGQLREEKKFRPWLMAIARRSALRMLSERKGTKVNLVGEEESGPRPDELAARSDDLELVMSSLAGLPEKYRLPMILFYREGESVAVVAAKLDLRPDAVKQRLKRGRDLLREKVESRMARALRMSAPGTVFTVGVATMVSQVGGAGTAVAAGAAGKVFVTSGSAAGTSSVASGATMMSSKFSTITAVAVVLVAVPVGYGVREAITQGEPSKAVVPSVVRERDAGALEVLRKRPLPPSQVVDEWERLLEAHGRTGAGMAAIHEEVSELEVGFVRKALRSVVVTEWVRLDARGGFEALFNGRDRESRYLFLEEWMKANPSEALEATVSWVKADSDRMFPLGAALILAERSPELFMDALLQLPDQLASSGSATEGLALIASQRPLELRDVAMRLDEGPRREVLAPALKGWGEFAPLAALDWIKSNEAEDERIQSNRFFWVTEGWSKERPREFLAKLNSICEAGPKGWKREVLYSRLATMALAELAKEDLEEAFRWWGKHRDEVSINQGHHKMTAVIREEVTRNPRRMIGILDEYDLLAETRTLFNNTGNTSDLGAKWQELGEAVKEVERSGGRDRLVRSVALELQERSPDEAIAFVELADGGLKDSWARKSVASKMVGQDVNLKRVEELVRKFPKWRNDFQAEGLQKVLVKSRESWGELNYREWIPMFEELAARDYFEGFNDYQPFMLHFGGPYLAEEPEAALSWMHGVMEGRMDANIEDNFVGQAIGMWLKEEPERAMAWASEKGLETFSDEVLDGMTWGVEREEVGLPFFWKIFEASEPGGSRVNMVYSLVEDLGVEKVRAGLEGIELTAKEQAIVEVFLKR
ncbi:MAG: RNA polymerase sigma factor [Roseibacillus sp.]